MQAFWKVMTWRSLVFQSECCKQFPSLIRITTRTVSTKREGLYHDVDGTMHWGLIFTAFVYVKCALVSFDFMCFVCEFE